MGMVDPEQIYDDMVRMFGKLPNPIHEPKRCQWYLKMYKYKRDQKSQT